MAHAETETNQTKRTDVLWSTLGGAILMSFFFATLYVLDNIFEPAMADAGHDKKIATFDQATATTPVLREYTRFHFAGKGYAQIQNTSQLRCATRKCNLALTVTFGSSVPESEIIVGQSFHGERGWHLFAAGGKLVLQIDGGAHQLDAQLVPNPGQPYKIEISNDLHGVVLRIDGNSVASGVASPFTDIQRDLTVGGRAGPSSNSLFGEVSGLKIFRAG